jgi:alkanesulfonate monooxygenase SsuD/methylene tetrahydromethanopterin reductase-like flavin-dependent oxidoreductase (luciferase family)
MHFGSFTLTDTPPVYGTGCRNPQQFLREVLAEALLAEALGFNSVWVPEHHFGLFGCLSFDESRARFDEEMQLVRTAWTEAGFAFAGTFHQVREPLTVLPRPVPPHPPIYVACFSRPTVEMAARSGFNAIFAPFAATMMFGSLLEAAAQCKALAREAGYPHSKVMCSYFFCLADSAAETLRAKERLLYYLQGILPAFLDDRRTVPPHIAYFVAIVERLRAMQPHDLGERSIVTGNLEQCLATLKCVEAAGIEEVILYFNFGAYTHTNTRHMMECFAGEVMPHFAA